MLDFQPSGITPRYAFEIGDEVVLDKTKWIVSDLRDDRYVFVQKDGQKLAQEFTTANIAYHAANGTLTHHPRRPTQVSTQATEEATAMFLASRTEEEHAAAKYRESYVLALLHLHAKGKVKFTDDSIKAAMAEIQVEACRIYASKFDGDSIFLEEHAPKTLIRWKNLYKKGGLAALYDNRRARGDRRARMAPEVYALMQPIVFGYMDRNQPSKDTIWTNVQTAFQLDNERREKLGLPQLKCPSRETVRQAIDALDPFEVVLFREGKTAARRKFSPVGQGLDIYRPMQRIEIDEWRVDLMKLLATSGLLEQLTQEELESLGLNKKSVRALVTVAIDVATRCIVGMKISLEGSSDSALQCVEMILEDKGIYADAVGALSPWHMSGKPSHIVTDCAKYNISNKTKRAIGALGITLEHCPAGEPAMKGTIERIFKTLATMLLPRLSGRTFSDVVRKGDANPEAQAALTIEEFCSVLVRWVVDVYHRKPHRGLQGDTPLEAWNRLTDQYGVAPPPNATARKLAFGQEETRVLQRNGLTLMNIPYHDELLAEYFMHRRQRELNIRWHPSDLGSIFVELRGKWIEVKAAPAWAQGLNAANWELTLRELNARRKRNEELSASVIARAIADITAVNENAMRREGILVEVWSKERIERLEDSMIGYADFGRDDTQDVEETTPSVGRFGMMLSAPGAGQVSTSAQDEEPSDVHDAENSQEMDRDSASNAPVTTSSETDRKTFSAPETSNVLPPRRRSGRGMPKASDDDNGFTFEE